MTAGAEEDLAQAYGLQPAYLGEAGDRRIAPVAAIRGVLRAMGVDGDDARTATDSLVRAPHRAEPPIAAPPGVRCFMPDWLSTGRGWGITCQLYGLRSRRNCGIGDFEDLAILAERAAAEGADFLGVNPLHALFTAAPERCSPFSPSNRRFLNPLYIALDRIPGVRGAPPMDEAARRRLCTADRIDYRAVAALKLGALRALWRRLCENPADWAATSRAAFDAFVTEEGPPLRDHARFEALSHRMAARGKGAGWHGWPERYRSADGAAVTRFAEEHDDDVEFHLWLQWIADGQLRDAAGRARSAGMRIGLYLDFAVGAAPDGSATWSDPELVVPGANIGAPPDCFFAAGQDWGLAPMSPLVLRERHFEPFRTMLASATRHAGAVRIDHAMSLYRLFWIPHGSAASDGCYVLYPLPEMLGALAEVSQSRRTVVIGEDLGTVPGGFRDLMKRIDMLSCRVLYFERTRGGYRAAASYRRNAFVSVSTHDLPPLAAWWNGEDIALFESLGVFDPATAIERRAARGVDREALVGSLLREQSRRPFAIPAPIAADAGGSALTPGVAAAIHAMLARTRTRLLGLQFEDLCAARVPVNVPGTSDEYPNWQLRAPVAIEDAPGSAAWSAIVGAVGRERPRRP